MENLVSVIMPAYNAEQFIAQSIASVQNQTHKNWELIIVNDGSKDMTSDVVNTLIKSDDRIQLIELEKNHGFPAVPRNTAIRKAQGKWLAMCDADDVWHPKKIETQLKILKQTSQVFCSTSMQDFRKDSEIEFSEPTNLKLETITFRRQLRRYRTPTSSIVIKREVMLKHLFKEDALHHSREDFECWLRIHENIQQSVKIIFPFMFYRVSNNQLSGSKIKMTKLTLRVLKNYTLLSGKKLGWRGYIYTLTHTLYALYYRIIMKKM